MRREGGSKGSGIRVRFTLRIPARRRAYGFCRGSRARQEAEGVLGVLGYGPRVIARAERDRVEGRGIVSFRFYAADRR